MSELAETQPAGPVRIVAARYTRPLVNALTLTGLRARAGDTGVGDLEAEAFVLRALRETQDVPWQVRRPSDHACRWELQNEADPDELFLEMSNPFENPYERGERGVLARLSLGGGTGASWYWVPLKLESEETDAEALSIHEQ